jgi:hypothetical protein
MAHAPISNDYLDHLAELFKVARFLQVTIGAQAVGTLHIAHVRGTAPYQSRNNQQLRVLLQVFQNPEAIHARHLQIHDDVICRRMNGAIRERAPAR